ncbi:MAG: extracellular solute-binding protein, partial [Chloroflexi bacterium]|nr:extracellular solute-binding protein [Chloroflexota bacterium]
TGDGKSYLIPYWSDVFGLIYRPSMLKEAVGTEEPPKTWDEVLSYSEKLKAKYGDSVAAFGADWTFAHRMFFPILNTFTDAPFTPEGVINVDDPSAKTTLEVMAKLYPYMPATSSQSLGASKAFQSGAVAMEIYWQTQLLRAIQAGQPEDDMKMVAFPQGSKTGTIFWTGGAVIPTYGENKEGALHFAVKGLFDPEAVKQSVVDNWKLVPFKSAVKGLEDEGVLPAWAPGLIATLDNTKPIPFNAYFLNVEQPVMQEELEKMFLQGQSVDDTLAAMKKRIAEGVAEMGD